MFRHILFDWSGTLVDDLGITIDATNRVFAHYGMAPFTRETFKAEFRLPYPDFYAEKMPGVALEELENHYRAAFDASAEVVSELPHARSFLDLCLDAGIECSILSSMDPQAFAAQADNLGMGHYFENIWTGVRDKAAAIHGLLAGAGIDPAHTAFIGDMTHDVETARHGGVTAIAVLTGYQDAARLAAAGADIIVPDLAALANLLRRATPAAR